jgi:hypothetical protein
MGSGCAVSEGQTPMATVPLCLRAWISWALTRGEMFAIEREGGPKGGIDEGNSELRPLDCRLNEFRLANNTCLWL